MKRHLQVSYRILRSLLYQDIPSFHSKEKTPRPVVSIWYKMDPGDGSSQTDKSKTPDDVSADQGMSHTEAMAKVKKGLADIIQNDPLLCDLPPEITLDEINSQIALEYGQAMVVNVRRADDQVMAVVVTQNATVLDLKHAIKRHFLLKQSREGGTTHLSWKYVWKRHWLYFDGQKLTEDNKKLKEYNIRNKDEVTFVKRLKER